MAHLENIMSLIFNIMLMVSHEPTQVTMLPAWPLEYGRIRAMRELGPDFYNRWWESRPLIGLPESDDPDAVTA